MDARAVGPGRLVELEVLCEVVVSLAFAELVVVGSGFSASLAALEIKSLDVWLEMLL